MLIGCYRNTYIRRKGLVRVEGLEHCQEEPVEDRLECTGWECTYSLYSVRYGIIFERRCECALPLTYSLEKSEVTRELALPASFKNYPSFCTPFPSILTPLWLGRSWHTHKILPVFRHTKNDRLGTIAQG
jgi:hypothetical protein